jgi:PleD family two-component response regulator
MFFNLNKRVVSLFCLPNTEIEATINRADDTLYKAKESGRNGVCLA